MTIQIHATAGDVAYFSSPGYATTHVNRRAPWTVMGNVLGAQGLLRGVGIGDHFVEREDLDELTEAMGQAKAARR